MGSPVRTRNGIKLCRFGGLSGVPQVHDGAPVRNGIHAFVWPFVEKFFLGGKPAENKNRRGDRFKDRCRTFFHLGPLYCRYSDLGEAREAGDTGWYLTDDEELFERVLRDIHEQRRWLNAEGGLAPGLLRDPFGNYGRRFWQNPDRPPAKSDYLPGVGMSVSRDQFEVFVPRGA